MSPNSAFGTSVRIVAVVAVDSERCDELVGRPEIVGVRFAETGDTLGKDGCSVKAEFAVCLRRGCSPALAIFRGISA